MTDPARKVGKTYYVQVEGTIETHHLEQLRSGVSLNDGMTLPAEATFTGEPAWLWPRTPPIRVRRQIPTSWLKLTIREGRNRQVRRMTSAVGLPTLRLIRWSIAGWDLGSLAPGEWRDVDAPDR